MLKQVADELRAIGLVPEVVDFPGFQASCKAVVIEIDVPNGRYKGKTLTLALSFQEDAYPEYPPHFVHLKSSVNTNIAARHSEHVFKDEKWAAYSLPPNDFWDALPSSQKNMEMYYKRHLLRIFAQL